MKKMSLQQAVNAFINIANISGIWRDIPEMRLALVEFSALNQSVGVEHTLEFAKQRYRELHPGECRVFSKGNACDCFLCSMDVLRSSLTQTVGFELSIGNLIADFSSNEFKGTLQCSLSSSRDHSMDNASISPTNPLTKS